MAPWSLQRWVVSARSPRWPCNQVLALIKVTTLLGGLQHTTSTSGYQQCKRWWDPLLIQHPQLLFSSLFCKPTSSFATQQRFPPTYPGWVSSHPMPRRKSNLMWQQLEWAQNISPQYTATSPALLYMKHTHAHMVTHRWLLLGWLKSNHRFETGVLYVKAWSFPLSSLKNTTAFTRLETNWCGQSSLYWPWSEFAHSAVWEMSKFSQAAISSGWPSCCFSDSHCLIYYFSLTPCLSPSPMSLGKKKKILYLLNKTTDRFDSHFWINRPEQGLFLRKILPCPLCPTLSCCSTTWI